MSRRPGGISEEKDADESIQSIASQVFTYYDRNKTPAYMRHSVTVYLL